MKPPPEVLPNPPPKLELPPNPPPKLLLPTEPPPQLTTLLQSVHLAGVPEQPAPKSFGKHDPPDAPENGL